MDSLDGKEAEALLPEADNEYCSHCTKKTKVSRHQFCHNIALYVAIFILIGFHIVRQPTQVKRLYSPANSAVAYHNVLFYDNIDHKSPYQGHSDDEKDQMWEDLYNGTSGTLITADEASKMPNRTQAVPGFHGQSIIVLEVFHQLHCLNTLRKSLYPSRFPSYAVFDPENGTVNPKILDHHEHCIDRIRQGIQCATNVGSVYYRWREDLQIWAPEMRDIHECRDFEAILRWTKTRQFSPWLGWDEQRPDVNDQQSG